MLSEESKNVAHSIEAELESFLHANFLADLGTERSRLEKAGEKPNKYLKKEGNIKGRNSNRFKFVNFSDRE